MTIDECIAVLTAHNKWRRGSDDMPQDSPATLGLAIDYAIEELHRLKVIIEQYAHEMLATELDERGS